MTGSLTFESNYLLRPAIQRAARLTPDWRVLSEIAMCVVPSLAAVAAGKPDVGAILYYAALLCILLQHAMLRDPLRFLSLLVGTIPAMMIFRDHFYYNSPQVLFATGLVLLFETKRQSATLLWHDPLVKAIIVAMTVYWLLAFAITRNYAANLRALELAFSVAAICVLGRRRPLLCTALLGIAVNILLQGLALLRFGDRLGMAEMEGGRVGNPISFGIPSALVFLLCIAHRGEWLMLREHPIWRTLITLLSATALLLSTSRGSWLVAFGGLIVIFITDRGQRKQLLGYACLVILAGLLLSQSSAGTTFGSYLNKTFDPEQSWAKRTTGRAAQWSAFPTVLAASPVWGFGPGTGRDIAAIYAGRYIIWHSLYLQIGAETGLLGLSLLALFLFALFQRATRQLRTKATVIPLLGALGYALIGVSVPGLDAASGLFLGLGLLSLKGKLYRVTRIQLT